MKRRRIRDLAALIVLSCAPLVAWSPPAQAMPSDEGDVSARADEYFRQGKALVKQGDLEGARKAYLEGFQLKRGYDIAGNLGNVELELGRPRDAAEHLTYCVRNFPATGTPKQLEFAKERLAEARKQVGALAIVVNVDGAEVFVDGKSIGRAPFATDVFVEPGARVIEARAVGHAATRQDIEATRGSFQSLALVLRPLPAQRVVKGPGPMVPYVPPEAPKKNLGLIVTGAAVSLAGLSVGFAGLGFSNGAAARAEEQRGDLATRGGSSACYGSARDPRCDDLDSALRQRESFRVVSIVGFTAAGLAAAATITYALLPSSPARQGSVRAGVALAPGSAGFELVGRF